MLLVGQIFKNLSPPPQIKTVGGAWLWVDTCCLAVDHHGMKRVCEEDAWGTS